ncbi:MAG: BON domain-containing protein [Planctomycetia bacterium]|nr:BON domain-containing protein [Planctomycetia bacterium]
MSNGHAKREGQEGTPAQSDRQRAIEAAAQERLRESTHSELRHISCDFQDGVLRLRGQVSTFHLKQLAHTLVRDTDGVSRVSNELEVPGP